MTGAAASAGARRFVLCTTPAQGHTAPLLALARRLVSEGHEVVFFTTAHYRDKVEATGASFVPFGEEYDAPRPDGDLRAILDGFPAGCIVVDTMFLGALPLALGARNARPALACVGVMPYASSSRDAAPFGVAFQPGSGPLHRLRNVTMN